MNKQKINTYLKLLNIYKDIRIIIIKYLIFCYLCNNMLTHNIIEYNFCYLCNQFYCDFCINRCEICHILICNYCILKCINCLAKTCEKCLYECDICYEYSCIYCYREYINKIYCSKLCIYKN